MQRTSGLVRLEAGRWGGHPGHSPGDHAGQPGSCEGAHGDRRPDPSPAGAPRSRRGPPHAGHHLRLRPVVDQALDRAAALPTLSAPAGTQAWPARPWKRTRIEATSFSPTDIVTTRALAARARSPALVQRVVAAHVGALANHPAHPDVVVLRSSSDPGDEERNTYDVGMSWLVRERPRHPLRLRAQRGRRHAPRAGRGAPRGHRSRSARSRSPRCGCASTAGPAMPPFWPAPTTSLRRAADAVRAPARLRGSGATLRRRLRAALDGLGAPAGEVDEGGRVGGVVSTRFWAGMFPAMTRMTLTPTGPADARAGRT